MGLPGAYLHTGRAEHDVRASVEAVRDYGEYVVPLDGEGQFSQASRCMNCGVPFCQSGLVFAGARGSSGCPLHNLIPETNDLLFQGRWDDAASRLLLTNPMPEFTSRVCPAPCEMACNLGLHEEPVTIHDNERALADHLWMRGIEPLAPASADAPLVSIVGSGPAGLAAAWELARRGARVRVYERDDRPGGLLMYGIPSMKLSKDIVSRRISLMEASGIDFLCGVDARDRAEEIMEESAAVILAIGARTARIVDVPGKDLDGIHLAVDYLAESTRALLEEREPTITAKGLDVAVIGGGDTGVDCIATALRQGARSVRQIIRAKRPPESVDTPAIWPAPRNVYSLGYGQREARDLFGDDPRVFSTNTIGYTDDGNGRVAGVVTQDIPDARETVEYPAQLVLIAKGFTGPEQPVLDAFEGASCTVHVAGDARTGSTIVASALADGLKVAEQVANEVLR